MGRGLRGWLPWPLCSTVLRNAFNVPMCAEKVVRSYDNDSDGRCGRRLDTPTDSHGDDDGDESR